MSLVRTQVSTMKIDSTYVAKLWVGYRRKEGNRVVRQFMTMGALN